MSDLIPSLIPNWIGGEELPARAGETLPKLDPCTGETICQVARSRAEDARAAVEAARAAQPAWAARTPVERGRILFDVVRRLDDKAKVVGGIVGLECGKPESHGVGETGAAVALGNFFAAEGQRLFGRTLPSGDPNRCVYTVREPMGVAALIVAANTPIANVAWKVFPALICGNAVVLKAAEDTPATAWIFAKVAHEAGLPPGVLNILQGYGVEAGAALVEQDIDVISFTGSSRVGRLVAGQGGERLIKVSLELGGKNALVVCDDADIDNALHWAVSSSFSNAGQRCAASSRIVVFDSVYEQFRDAFVERAKALTLGNGDDDFLGPVINERQLTNMLEAVSTAREAGATVLCGGERAGGAQASGFFCVPTIVEGVDPGADISCSELFGPITCLYRVGDLDEAIAVVNTAPYGLTSSIHTKSVHRAMVFARKVQAGVTSVNRGTHGSEPHMPFGGPKSSGNGWREPGTEALDVYTELKNVHIGFDPTAI